jgi:hypothetical protein
MEQSMNGEGQSPIRAHISSACEKLAEEALDGHGDEDTLGDDEIAFGRLRNTGVPEVHALN